jgi:hypothetical protein
MRSKTNFLLVFIFYAIAISAQTTLSVNPNTNASINGNLELNRAKYFNLADDGIGTENRIKDSEIINKYFDDYNITLGRALGLVNGWKRRVVEDKNKPGYVDIDDLKSKIRVNDSESPEFRNRWSNLDVALHDRHSAYPNYMNNYNPSEDSHEEYPANVDAASDLAVALLKYNFNDWNRPGTYEIVNEPHYSALKNKDFADLHTAVHQKAKKAGIKTDIGGPCYSVGYFYKKNYSSLNNFTQFIDNTNANLDFYSFHIYDFLKWNDDYKDFRGEITAGLPLEGVIDALQNYTVNNYNKEIPIVVSEHGGYLFRDDQNWISDELATELLGAGSGFDYEMKRRSIHCFLMTSSVIANTMTFMNNPHVVRKSVPFILLETTGWNQKYYASLLVPENFEKGSPWHETELINFYKLFTDVKGRRVESFCDNQSIQYNTFVDGKDLFIVINNLSTIDEQITFDIANQKFNNFEVKRHGRNSDFTPYFKDSKIDNLDGFVVKSRESVVLKLTSNEDIVAKENIDIKPYYSNKVAQTIDANSSEKFEIKVPEYKNAKSAILRIGVGRDSDMGHNIDVKLNGTKIEIPVENIADYLDGKDYGTTKIVKVTPSILKKDNVVEISFPDGKVGGVGAVVLRVGS